MESSPNPNLPSLRKIQEEVLNPDERRAYEAYYRSLIERPSDGTYVSAGAFLWAEKPAAAP